jgi:hypothetical protein
MLVAASIELLYWYVIAALVRFLACGSKVLDLYVRFFRAVRGKTVHLKRGVPLRQVVETVVILRNDDE